MKTSFLVSAVLVSLWVSGIPACGGKSDSKGGEGGAGGSTMDGLAGSGAGPATHASECETICERTKDTPGCTSDTGTCLLVCATITGYPSCGQEIDNWVNCVKRSDITCDDSGTPAFADCDAQTLSVTGCALMQQPPPAVEKSCDDYCAEMINAGCSLASEYGDCADVCGVAGLVVSKCQKAFVDFTTCQAKAGITCDESGNPQMTGCESEYLIYLGCVATEVGQGTSDL